MPPDPTAPPGSLDATSKTRYRKYRAALREQGTWRDTDRGQLVRYVQAERVASQNYEILEREGYVVDGVRGRAAHPSYAIWRGAVAAANDVAKQLLLSAQTRRQYEIEVRRETEEFGSFLE